MHILTSVHGEETRDIADSILFATRLRLNTDDRRIESESGEEERMFTRAFIIGVCMSCAAVIHASDRASHRIRISVRRPAELLVTTTQPGDDLTTPSQTSIIRMNDYSPESQRMTVTSPMQDGRSPSLQTPHDTPFHDVEQTVNPTETPRDPRIEIRRFELDADGLVRLTLADID